MENNIKQLRKDSKLTLQAIAEACGTCKSNIHALESGKQTPTLRMAYRLAAVLSASVYDVWPDITEVEERTITIRKIKGVGNGH